MNQNFMLMKDLNPKDTISKERVPSTRLQPKLALTGYGFSVTSLNSGFNV